MTTQNLSDYFASFTINFKAQFPVRCDFDFGNIIKMAYCADSEEYGLFKTSIFGGENAKNIRKYMNALSEILDLEDVSDWMLASVLRNADAWLNDMIQTLIQSECMQEFMEFVE